MIALDKKIKERRQLVRELTKISGKPQSTARQESEPAAIAKSSEEANQAKVLVKIQKKEEVSAPALELGESEEAKAENTYVEPQIDQEDDVESYDSNPALFSDEEDQKKKNPLAAVEAILTQSRQLKASQRSQSVGRP